MGVIGINSELIVDRYGHVQQLNRLLREETDVALRVNTPELLVSRKTAEKIDELILFLH